MHGRKSYGNRFAGMGIAILLFAGLSQSQPFSPRAVRAGDQREATPIAPDLIRAIRDADAPAVRKRIDNGADVNARDAEGNTPLLVASFYASPECVELLLAKGADAANKAGVTALIRAALNAVICRRTSCDPWPRTRGADRDRCHRPPADRHNRAAACTTAPQGKAARDARRLTSWKSAQSGRHARIDLSTIRRPTILGHGRSRSPVPDQRLNNS
jgi:hypothetical protein